MLLCKLDHITIRPKVSTHLAISFRGSLPAHEGRLVVSWTLYSVTLLPANRHILALMPTMQNKKSDRFIRNAKIKRPDHVLKIGNRKTGCWINSLALTGERKAVAVILIQRKIHSADGLTDDLKVRLCDHQALPLL